MPIVKIRWGSEQTQEEIYEDEKDCQEYAFATQAEADAFLYGVSEMDGWTDYEVLEDEDAGSE